MQPYRRQGYSICLACEIACKFLQVRGFGQATYYSLPILIRKARNVSSLANNSFTQTEMPYGRIIAQGRITAVCFVIVPFIICLVAVGVGCRVIWIVTPSQDISTPNLKSFFLENHPPFILVKSGVADPLRGGPVVFP